MKTCLGAALALLLPTLAQAATDCRFDQVGDVLALRADCTTDATIFVPEGMTLDGQGHSIRAVDPPDRPFRGAILENEGAEMHVRDVELFTAGLKSVCHGIQDANAPAGADICDRDLIPDPRLKGVYFRCAAGSAEGVRILRVHQSAFSPCQEGIGIEARNATDGAPLPVVVRGNYVRQYQKVGVLLVGGVDALVEDNLLLARESHVVTPNGIQVGAGARAVVADNRVFYNRYTGLAFAAAGILVEGAQHAEVVRNSLGGNDVGVWVLDSEDTLVEGNFVQQSTLFGVAVDDQSGAVDKAVIRDNDVDFNPYGIGVVGLNASQTQVLGNRLKGNGIALYSGPEAPETGFVDNVVWNSTHWALVVEGHGALVQDNRLTDNANDGITINGDDNVLLGNAVRRSEDAGLYVDGTGNRIEGNDVQVNGGLDIDNVGANAFSGNVCGTSSGPPVDCGG